MDANNENTEPVSDLGLALSYPNQCIQSMLNGDSGAGVGANAVLMLDMTFVANEPLSELVWSTDKGPSNVTLSPPQSTMGGRSAADKPIDEENVVTPNTSFHVKCEVAGKDALISSPTSDAGMLACGASHVYETETGANVEELKTAANLSILDKQVETCALINFKDDQVPDKPATGEILFTTLQASGDADGERADMIKSDEIRPFVGQNEPLSSDPVGEDIHVDDGKSKRGMNFLLNTKSYITKSKDSGALVLGQFSPGRSPLDKLESTADNDIQIQKSVNAHGTASQKQGSEQLLRDKESFEKVEEMLHVNNSGGKHSPTDSRIHKHRRKGKEKALSDGDTSCKTSKEEDDSHESVESCNSARLFSSSKKRWGFDEQFIVGSKRLRNQIQETSGCPSSVKQDSSFMNWISSMTKGFTKSIQDKALPLPLTIVHPDHACESSDKELITYNKNADAGNPGIKTIGFQSIFQSLYCLPDDEGTRKSSCDHEIGERIEELEPASSPKDFHEETNKVGKRSMLPVVNFNKYTCGNELSSAIQPDVLSIEAAGSQEKGINHSVENKTASNLEYDRKKGVVGSSFSLGKRKIRSAENLESDPQSKQKTTDNTVHRNCLLGNLWITRFMPKMPCPSTVSDRYTVGAGLDCFIEKNNVGVKELSVEDVAAVSGKELQDCAADSAGSLANRYEGHSDEKPITKLNPVFSAPKSGGSEAMTSVFSRRLDALKHIPPTGITGNAADKIMTCFFCGIKGHHLRECVEIKDAKLLPSKFKSYNGAEYMSSFCIRCFEKDHWAIACPNGTTSVGQPQLESNLSYYCSPSGTNHNAEGNMKLLIGKENQFRASVDQDETDLNMSWKSITASKKTRPSSNSVKRYNASSSGQNKFKENQIMALSLLVNMPVSDIPKGISDSVNRLRLSRTDILKWMDSNTSISNLEGFFLRLRLGKCETGRGGTGYYVSCITEIGSQRNVENSISVIVGGIRCFVETQYISNHDFLEDELREWWSATSKNSSTIPSEEDLREKVKLKTMLGL